MWQKWKKAPGRIPEPLSTEFMQESILVSLRCARVRYGLVEVLENVPDAARPPTTAAVPAAATTPPTTAMLAPATSPPATAPPAAAPATAPPAIPAAVIVPPIRAATGAQSPPVELDIAVTLTTWVAPATGVAEELTVPVTEA